MNEPEEKNWKATGSSATVEEGRYAFLSATADWARKRYEYKEADRRLAETLNEMDLRTKVERENWEEVTSRIKPEKNLIEKWWLHSKIHISNNRMIVLISTWNSKGLNSTETMLPEKNKSLQQVIYKRDDRIYLKSAVQNHICKSRREIVMMKWPWSFKWLEFRDHAVERIGNQCINKCINIQWLCHWGMYVNKLNCWVCRFGDNFKLYN